MLLKWFTIFKLLFKLGYINKYNWFLLLTVNKLFFVVYFVILNIVLINFSINFCSKSVIVYFKLLVE